MTGSPRHRPRSRSRHRSRGRHQHRAPSRRLLGLLRPQRHLLAGVVALEATHIGLVVLGPWLLGRATDLALAGIITPGHGPDFDAIGSVLLWACAAFVLAELCDLLQARLANLALQRMISKMRADVQAKISRLPVRYFDRPRGEVLSRVTNDIENLGQSLQQSMSQVVASVLTVVGVLSAMFWISWMLALIALVTVPVSVVVATRLGKLAQPQFTAQWQITGRLNAHVEEMYTGHALVRAFDRQAETAQTFREHNERLYAAGWRAQLISGLMLPAMMFISNLNYVVVAVVGGLKVASGSLSIGHVQAFVQYSRQFSQPLSQIAGMANLLQSGVASAERIFELLDTPEQKPDPATSAHPGRVAGRVAFEHVCFRYQPDIPLIDDLSLTAEPGHTVAIVGPTGAGKTTLINLLMRFYEPTAGRITLDGVDVAEMSREQLRASIGTVLQDTWLFGGTIAENIAYGAEGATREQVVAATRAAHADRFVRTLPAGYDTLLDDEGSGVSAGEKQLITIARAFLLEPAILVLDEATSSVDARTEVLIQRAMAALRAKRTAFVIAHRLSTVRDADTILVMDNGAIVEQGNHTDLLAARGAYARLYQAQLAAARLRRGRQPAPTVFGAPSPVGERAARTVGLPVS